MAFSEGTGVSAGLTVGLGGAIAGNLGVVLANPTLRNFIAYGLVGGLSSEIQGGNFASGFLAGGVGSLAGPLGSGQFDTGKLIGSAVLGGLASVLGGGKFANGAITGAFAYAASTHSEEAGAGFTKGPTIGVEGKYQGEGEELYDQARDYLEKFDPATTAAFNKFEASGTSLNFNSSAVDEYLNGQVFWDPAAAFQTPGGIISPALALYHEIMHAIGPWYEPLLGLIPSSQYDTMEEERVITQYEQPAARNLGEGVRYCHCATKIYETQPPSPTWHGGH